jgi:hypothetical protein
VETYEPKGFWWDALVKGLKLGVEASSDHISTHASYAMIYTPDAGRSEIVESMRQRHAYAATDNIVVDFEAAEQGGPRHLMGDEFGSRGRPLLHVKVMGTAPITSVELIRDNEFVYTQRSGRADADFTYTDQSPPAGENWYYVHPGEAGGRQSRLDLADLDPAAIAGCGGARSAGSIARGAFGAGAPSPDQHYTFELLAAGQANQVFGDTGHAALQQGVSPGGQVRGHEHVRQFVEGQAGAVQDLAV